MDRIGQSGGANSISLPLRNETNVWRPESSVAAQPEASFSNSTVLPPSDQIDLHTAQAVSEPGPVSFIDSTGFAGFQNDFSRPETVLLAAKYLSDNPETVVQSGSGVLAPERPLPQQGISRMSTYHSFVTADTKQAYVTVSSEQGASFRIRGQGAALRDPLNASLEANERYPNAGTQTLTILNAEGLKRQETLRYDLASESYQPALTLQPGERAFIPVGPKIRPTPIGSDAALETAHKRASQTLVAHVDVEPVSGQLSAGTYVEGQEQNRRDQGLQSRDYQRVAQSGPADFVQTPISDYATESAYGQYQGEDPAQAPFKTAIKPHHSVYLELDPSGVIPYALEDMGIDSTSQRPFVRLIGVRDGQARVDSDEDRIFNEAGDQVFAAMQDREKGGANYEASAGFISRTRPAQPISADEGDKDGYGLPYQLPNQLFAHGNARPQAGEILNTGRLILRGDSLANKSKYAVTVIDADNQIQQVKLGFSEQSSTSTRNNFWTFDLSQTPMKLPLRVVTLEGSDLGLQAFYDPPGGQDLKARATQAVPGAAFEMPYMTE